LSAERIINTLGYTSIQINTLQYLSVQNRAILHKMFFVVSPTQYPNRPLLLHLSFRLLYQPLCWVFWLYNLIGIAISIAIAINIIIAIFVTSLTTAIAVILLYLPTTFHLLPLPFFIFAFVTALFTSASASLAQLQNSV
jgi:hypothetical protein